MAHHVDRNAPVGPWVGLLGTWYYSPLWPVPIAAPPMAGGRFHDDEARPLQMLQEPLGDDARHDLAGAASVLSAAVAHRKDVASFRSKGSGMPLPKSLNKETRRITTAIG